MYFFKKAYNFVVLTLLIVGLLIIPFLKYLIKDMPINVYIYLAYILFLFSTISTYISSYKRNIIYANQKKYILNIIEIVYIIVQSIIQIIILLFTKNYCLFLLVKIICILLQNVFISYMANRLYPFIKNDNIEILTDKIKNSIIKRVKAIFIHKTARSITNGMDNILISAFLGIKTLGLYVNYNYIIVTLKKVLLNIISSTGASIGNLLLEEDYNKNYIVFKRIILLDFWISVFSSICIYELSSLFIKIWLGESYIIGNLVVLLLAVNYFQSMMRETFNVFKEAAGIWIEDRFCPIVQCGMNLIVSILLLKAIGLPGVFLGTIISSGVVWLYSYPKYVYKKIFNRKIIDYYIELLKHIMIYVMILFIFFILNRIVNNDIIIMICSFVIPNLLLFILFFKTEEFTYYVDLITRRMKIWKRR